MTFLSPGMIVVIRRAVPQKDYFRVIKTPIYFVKDASKGTAASPQQEVM